MLVRKVQQRLNRLRQIECLARSSGSCRLRCLRMGGFVVGGRFRFRWTTTARAGGCGGQRLSRGFR